MLLAAAAAATAALSPKEPWLEKIDNIRHLETARLSLRGNPWYRKNENASKNLPVSSSSSPYLLRQTEHPLEVAVLR